MRVFLPAIVALALAHGAGGETSPIVARSELPGGGSAGDVFFLPAAEGAVAVGAAHSFDRAQLAEALEIHFLGPGGEPIARSRRYFAPPGRPYHAAGATMRDDFLVFALPEPPRGVRVLEPAPALPGEGAALRIVNASGSEIRGRVARSDGARIEVDLEGLPDLRGWGGAPVLEGESGRVIGLLQAAWPAGGRWRAGVGPIGGVLEAIARPYDGGLGRLFATEAPQASAANSPLARRREATGSAHGDPGAEATRLAVASAAQRAPQPPRAREGPPSLAIEYPPRGSRIGDAGVAFVSGHATAVGPSGGRFDLVIVLDVSDSTSAPSGADVDGDGVVGHPVAARFGASSDPGDSILAAETAAARRLLSGLDARRTRVGLIVFGGDAIVSPGLGRGVVQVKRAALTVEPLTSDVARIERALSELREPSPGEATHMAAGIDQATLELLGLRGALSRTDRGSEKIALFFTDGRPTLPVPDSEAANVRAVLEAARRARALGVRIHSFALGPEALAGPIAPVEMAAITDGLFTPVRHPGELARFVDTVRFAAVDEVVARNATSGQPAHQVRLHADGAWEALVPLEPGENRLEIVARADDRQRREEIVVVHEPAAAGPPIPAELVARRGQLLRGRLEALERERMQRIRKELVIEIERERTAAVERARRMRKKLRIEVERRNPGEP